MTIQGEAASPMRESGKRSKSPDLFGPAYLAGVGIVMVAWLAILVWLAWTGFVWLVG